jgi:hypothetical protein
VLALVRGRQRAKERLSQADIARTYAVDPATIWRTCRDWLTGVVGHIPRAIAISSALLFPIPAKLIVMGCSNGAPANHADCGAFTEATLASLEHHGETLT